MSTYASAVTRTRLAPLAIVAAIGGVEALMVWRFGWSVALLPYGYFGVIAVVLAAHDIATRKLPNAVVLPSFPTLLGLFALASEVDHDWSAFVRALLAMAILGIGLLLLALVFVGHTGLGDVKIGALVGLTVGWVSWPGVYLAVLAAFILAWCWSIPKVVTRSKERVRLPFGPFLMTGALLAILVR